MIQFATIPVDIRTPGTFVEYDATRAVAGPAAGLNRLVLIGQAGAGSAAANVPVAIASTAAAIEAFGRGSMLAGMCAIALHAARGIEIVAVPVAAAAGATAAERELTFTGAASAAGVVDLRIAGRIYRFTAPIGTDAVAAAQLLVQRIAADTEAPVTAVAAAGVVTLTARQPGAAGNDIDVRLSNEPGNVWPTDLTLAIGAIEAGTGSPSIAGALGAIADLPAQLIVSAFTDADNLDQLVTELADRQGAERMIDGVGLVALRGTAGALAALGEARNSEWLAIAGTGATPTSPWFAAAAIGAIVTASAAADPARPLHTLVAEGVIPPAGADRFDRREREQLLRAGVSTFTVTPAGALAIERMVTTAQLDQAGNETVAWLDLETPLTLAHLRRGVRQRITTKFARHKLADDDSRFAAGQAIVTPRTLSAELLALFREYEEQGLVENLDQFKADLRVERDPADPNRVNALIPPDLVNQLRVFAAAIQFRR